MCCVHSVTVVVGVTLMALYIMFHIMQENYGFMTTVGVIKSMWKLRLWTTSIAVDKLEGIKLYANA